MHKQHFRALRWEDVAQLFPAGLERFRQLILPNRAGLSTGVRAIKAAAIAACLIFAFEATKHALYPKTSIWTSHTITILFTMLAAAVVIFAALNRNTEDALRRSETEYRCLFDSNPLPMWVFERKTLKFLAVNEAASRQYGFSSREFLTMTIADIRPEEDIANLLEATAKSLQGLQEPTIWRHRKKNGAVIDVEIVGHDLHWHGIEAELVTARDVTERRRVQDAMIESEGRYRSLFENMWEGFAHCEMLFDGDGRPIDFVYLAVNSAFDTLTGLQNVVGKRFTEVIPEGRNSQAELFERFSRVVLTGEPERFDIEIEALARWFSVSAYSAGKGCFIAVFDNITERKRAEEALLFKTALLEAQAETTIDGILAVDESDHIVLANKQFGLQFEIPDELLSTRDDHVVLKHVIAKVEAPEAFVERVKYLNTHREEKSRDEFRFKNGKVFDRYSAPLVDSKGQYRGRIWYFRDITDRKVAEERVKYLAYYDALTGLPNRTLLQDRLAKALAGARRQKHKVALLFLDLDGFKDINDSLGHSVGDLLLQEVAERLKTWGREQDTVARLGGDEFLIMLTDVKDIPDAAVAAERLMDAMTAEFVIQGHSTEYQLQPRHQHFPGTRCGLRNPDQERRCGNVQRQREWA